MSIGMLRVGGAFCLVFCGWCVGDTICVRGQEHQKALQKTVLLFERIRREIEFRRTDLNRLLRSLQEEELADRDAPSLQQIPPFSPLTRREQSIFRECMTGLGHLDAAQECQRLAFYQEQFEVFQRELAPKLKTTQELSRKLGLAVGLAVAILLL